MARAKIIPLHSPAEPPVLTAALPAWPALYPTKLMNSLHSPVNGIAALAEKGVQRRFSAYTLLIQEGDLGDTLYIILSGKLRAFASGERGKEITLGVFGAGDYVGEMALDGGPRSANVQTLVPTVCSVVSRDTLRSHIASHPDFAFEMMARLIRRARLATESVRSLALIDTYGRLTRLLDQLSTDQHDGTRVLLDRLTHLDLANHVACSREMISRLLKDLEAGGYLTTVDRRLVILKPFPARW
jgi:CRP/FNR family cyclic AMP-dependent transcriptional regulator